MYSHIGSSFGMFLAPPVLDLTCIRTFGSSFGMFLALPVLDLSCIRTLDLHLACFLHLLCWILVVFVHWIFDCFVSVAILWIKPLISSPVYTGVLLLAQAAKPPAAMKPNIFS